MATGIKGLDLLPLKARLQVQSIVMSQPSDLYSEMGVVKRGEVTYAAKMAMVALGATALPAYRVEDCEGIAYALLSVLLQDIMGERPYEYWHLHLLKMEEQYKAAAARQKGR